MCRKACGFKSHHPHSIQYCERPWQPVRSITAVQAIFHINILQILSEARVIMLRVYHKTILHVRNTALKIETTFQEDHQVKITAEIAAEQFEESKQRAARKLAKKVKIPGFRPGKAPFAVIVRQLGEGAILEEALDLLVEEAYPKIIEEAGIKPYGPGSLEKISSMDPPVLEFVVPLQAEVNIGDYRSLNKEYNLPEVEDQEVDAVLNNLRQQHAILEDADRPAQDSDLVTVKLSAKRAEAESEEEAVLIKESSFPILVQSEPAGSEDKPHYEWPFKGFSKNLINMSVGDEKSFEFTYPEDADQESFRGVKAVFDIKVESIKARLLPEINDDFAKSMSEFDTLEELLKEIRTMLEEQSRSEYDGAYIDELLEQAIELGEFKYPPQMLEHELNNLIQNLENRLHQQNMTMELYLKSREMEMEALREETRPFAEKQLRKHLFLVELAEAEGLQIDQAELMQETNNTMNYLASGMTAKEVKKLSNRNVYTNVLTSVYSNLLNRASMDRLRDIANGKLAEIEIAQAAEAQAKAAAEAAAATAAMDEEPESSAEDAQPEASSSADSAEA